MVRNQPRRNQNIAKNREDMQALFSRTQKVKRSAANGTSKRPTFITASRSKGGSMLQENSKRLCHLSSLSPTRIIADNIRSTLISIELCFSSRSLGEDLVNRTEV